MWWDNFNWFFILLALVGGFLPTFFWLWFWLQADRKKPEPTRLIAKTFIIGGFFIVPAFILEKIFAPDVNNQVVSTITTTWQNYGPGLILLSAITPIAIWAIIEELIKYLGAYISALKKKDCDEPIDVMIYMITASLGFAAVENFLFLLNNLLVDGHYQGTFLLTGNLRFLGATLLHVIASASFGASIGFAFYRSRPIKWLAWILGLFFSSALHTLFNFFIIINEGGRVFLVLIALWFVATIVIFLFEAIKRFAPKQIINPINRPYV